MTTLSTSSYVRPAVQRRASVWRRLRPHVPSIVLGIAAVVLPVTLIVLSYAWSSVWLRTLGCLFLAVAALTAIGILLERDERRRNEAINAKTFLCPGCGTSSLYLHARWIRRVAHCHVCFDRHTRMRAKEL